MKKLAIALCASAFVALAAPAFAEDNSATGTEATQATEATQNQNADVTKKSTHKKHARKHKKQHQAEAAQPAADATNNEAQPSN